MTVAKDLHLLSDTCRQYAQSVERDVADRKNDPRSMCFWNIHNRMRISEEIMTNYEKLWSSEGFPEVAEAYKRIAFEEAEHAAKFAELLGEVVIPCTKTNLKVRVEAENGATAGKLALAKKAKQLGYDAIHDTVHEMCKDEARHGCAFNGLLKRYFSK